MLCVDQHTYYVTKKDFYGWRRLMIYKNGATQLCPFFKIRCPCPHRTSTRRSASTSGPTAPSRCTTTPGPPLWTWRSWTGWACRGGWWACPSGIPTRRTTGSCWMWRSPTRRISGPGQARRGSEFLEGCLVPSVYIMTICLECFFRSLLAVCLNLLHRSVSIRLLHLQTIELYLTYLTLTFRVWTAVFRIRINIDFGRLDQDPDPEG